MTLLGHITMFGYPLLVLLLFALLPGRQAVIVTLLGGWLFLPDAVYVFHGLPEYTKMSACCIAPMLGAFLFDTRRIMSFRPRWIDLPMVLWCVCPMFSSLSNGLGLYDGLSGVFRQTVSWGLPYFVGRVYMRDLSGLRSLAVALFVAGLIYVPLCLYEMRMSPQLHRMLYGFHPGHVSGTARRFGGFRPRVFVGGGGALGMWMAMCSLTAVWLWANRALRRLWGIPAGGLVALLLVVTVLCRSLGAIVLLVLGLAAIYAAKWTRTRAPIIVLVALVPLYMSARASGLWSGSQLLRLAATVSAARAASLQTRLVNEDALAKKALRRPVLGWGAWGRHRIYDETGRDISLTDGLWIVALGKYGFVGLISLTGALLLPVLVLAMRYPPELWWTPSWAPATAIAMVSVLFMVNGLPNAGQTPVYVLAAGGISGFCMINPALARRDLRNEMALLTAADVRP